MVRKKNEIVPELRGDIEGLIVGDFVKEEEKLPDKMTLYQAYRRMAFSKDPDENLRIYNKKRRGYEGLEKKVLVSIFE